MTRPTTGEEPGTARRQVGDAVRKGGARMGSLAKRMWRLGLLGMLLAGVWGGAGAGTATALEVGERAPDFTLPSTTGEEITLSQFRGKKLVLLEFYVHDFGPT